MTFCFYCLKQQTLDISWVLGRAKQTAGIALSSPHSSLRGWLYNPHFTDESGVERDFASPWPHWTHVCLTPTAKLLITLLYFSGHQILRTSLPYIPMSTHQVNTVPKPFIVPHVRSHLSLSSCSGHSHENCSVRILQTSIPRLTL